jgi:GT2 family glycosyltransferase
MVRRTAFDQVGGMDAGFFLYWEDADLCRRLKNRGWRTVYLPHVSVVHRGGRGSRQSAARSLRAFHASAFRYYWKHSSVMGRLFAPLVFAGLQARLAFTLVWLELSAGETER